MIDVETIRAAYANMPDESLKIFAKTDANGLTQKAFIVLKQELRKRGFVDIMNEAEAKRVEEKIEVINNNQQKYNWENHKKLWHFILNSKFKNMPDTELMQALVEKGYSPEDATLLIASVTTITDRLIEDGSFILQTGNAGQSQNPISPIFEKYNSHAKPLPKVIQYKSATQRPPPQTPSAGYQNLANPTNCKGYQTKPALTFAVKRQIVS